MVLLLQRTLTHASLSSDLAKQKPMNPGPSQPPYFGLCNSVLPNMPRKSLDPLSQPYNILLKCCLFQNAFPDATSQK